MAKDSLCVLANINIDFQVTEFVHVLIVNYWSALMTAFFSSLGELIFQSFCDSLVRFWNCCRFGYIWLSFYNIYVTVLSSLIVLVSS